MTCNETFYFCVYRLYGKAPLSKKLHQLPHHGHVLFGLLLLLRLDLVEFLSQEASRVLTGPDSQSNPVLEASNGNVTPKTHHLRPSRALLPSHLPPLGVSLMSELRRKQKELPTMPNIHQFSSSPRCNLPIIHTVLDLVREKQ